MRKIIISVLCAGFASSAFAELIEVKLSSGETVEKQLTVAPGKFVELCSALQRGQVVAWQFRADPATDFNIHYHVDKQVEYPEKREEVRVASGRLTANVDQSYCWTWRNRSATPIALEVRLNLPR